MNHIKLLLQTFLLITFLVTNLSHAADPTAVLKSALKKESSSLVDYSSGCPDCLKEIKSRPKATLNSAENNQSIELSVLTEKEVNALFSELVTHKEIPFEFPFDGCYARAQAMAKIMEDKGIICGKAFVEGELMVNSEEFGEVKWSYHVAPVVLVKIGNKNVPYVIDPSITKKPVPYEDWKKQMTSAPNTKKTSEYFTNRFSYDPNDKMKSYKTLPEEYEDDYPAVNKAFTRMLVQFRELKSNK